jgi:transposase-like protein
LGNDVRHRTSRYLNNRIEQDHRGIKARYDPMRGFGAAPSAARFCLCHDELRNHLRLNRHRRTSPASVRRLYFIRQSQSALNVLITA